MTLLEHKTEGGFTLIEVLAALALFSLAALALVRVSAENAKTARLVEIRAFAGIVADNRLTETLVQQQRLEVGRARADVELGGRTWRIEETIAPTDNRAILEIRVRVTELVELGAEEGPSIERIAFKAIGL